MKKLIILLVILSISVLSSYADDFLDSIPVNPKEYTKCEKCTAVIKSSINDYELWYDPDKWEVFLNEELSEPATEEAYNFELKLTSNVGGVFGFDTYIVNNIDALKVLESRLNDVKKNVQRAREFRNINGNKVMYYEHTFDKSFFKPSYRHFHLRYYSQENMGAIKINVGVYEKDLDRYRADVEEFISGMIVK